MKSIFLGCLAAICFQSVQAQQINWFDSSAEWTFHIESGWVGYGIERVKIVGDSTVAGVVYQKTDARAMFKSGASHQLTRLIRQDGDKIYSRNAAGKDVLMYDFSMKVGDELALPVYWSELNSLKYKVLEVGTLKIGGKDLRKQVVQWDAPVSAKSTFVEGLGEVEATHKIGGVDCLTFSYLFLDEPSMVAIDGPGRTFCGFQSTALGSFEGMGNVFCKALAAPVAGGDLFFSVSPNPNFGEFRVETESAEEVLEVSLFDLAGRLIFEKTLASGSAVSTDFRGLGVLLVRSERGLARRAVRIF